MRIRGVFQLIKLKRIDFASNRFFYGDISLRKFPIQIDRSDEPLDRKHIRIIVSIRPVLTGFLRFGKPAAQRHGSETEADKNA